MREEKHEAILTIPPIVRLVVVRIEPPTIVVTVEVEQVRITIGNARLPIYATIP